MEISDCYYLGFVSRIFQKNGNFTIRLDTDRPENYLGLKSILIQLSRNQRSPVPFTVRKIVDLHGNDLTLSLDPGQVIPDFSGLKGKSVYLPLADLKPLKGNAYYFHEVIGYAVEDDREGYIGTVSEIYEMSAHPIAAVDSNGTEILIPMTKEIFYRRDKEKKLFRIRVPEGLIELYRG